MALVAHKKRAQGTLRPQPPDAKATSSLKFPMSRLSLLLQHSVGQRATVKRLLVHVKWHSCQTPSPDLSHNSRRKAIKHRMGTRLLNNRKVVRSFAMRFEPSQPLHLTLPSVSFSSEPGSTISTPSYAPRRPAPPSPPR